jgi:hypothetical protein
MQNRIDWESWLVQVETSKAWFTRRVLPLSLEQVRWRPGPSRWSIAECLDHLNRTFSLYQPKIDQAIAHASREGFSFGPAQELREFEYLRHCEPPVQVRMASPPVLIPSPAVDTDFLADFFHDVRDRYADAIRRASGLDLARVAIWDPIFPCVPSLRGTLALLAAHDRRHLWQAERVRNDTRFPRALFASVGRSGTSDD